MLLERGDDAGAEVRERADIEDGAASCELGDEPRNPKILKTVRGVGFRLRAEGS